MKTYCKIVTNTMLYTNTDTYIRKVSYDLLHNSNSAVSWTLRQEKHTLKTASDQQKEVSMLTAKESIASSAKTSFDG